MRLYLTRVATALVIALATQGGLEPAAAGTPWSCQCNGKPKRFIGATHACEHTLYAGTKKYIAGGPKWYLPYCTSAQWKTWNRNACKSEGCTLLR